MSVDLGLHDQTNPEAWVKSLVVNLAVKHPSYDSSVSQAHDIALLRFSHRLTKFSNVICPACLNRPNTDFDNGSNKAVACG